MSAQTGDVSLAPLLLTAAVAVLLWLLMRPLRAKLSRDRRERWAREDAAYRERVERSEGSVGTDRPGDRPDEG